VNVDPPGVVLDRGEHPRGILDDGDASANEGPPLERGLPDGGLDLGARPGSGQHPQGLSLLDRDVPAVLEKRRLGLHGAHRSGLGEGPDRLALGVDHLGDQLPGLGHHHDALLLGEVEAGGEDLLLGRRLELGGQGHLLLLPDEALAHLGPRLEPKQRRRLPLLAPAISRGGPSATPSRRVRCTMMRLTTLRSSTLREGEKPHMKLRRFTARRSEADTRADPLSGGITSLHVSRNAVSSSPLSFMLGIAAHSTDGACPRPICSRASWAVRAFMTRCMVGLPSVAF
jgi:hypothetical protein